jgi:hypothetical protein
MYIHTYIHTYVCIYMHAYIHTYIHTDTHTSHTHTHTHAHQVAPEDMEGAASMAANDKYIVFGGLDGWITLLQALEPSK